MTPTDPKPAPATDEEIAEWNPALRNIEAAVYPWKVARLIARIESDRARIDELKSEAKEAKLTIDGLKILATHWEAQRDEARATIREKDEEIARLRAKLEQAEALVKEGEKG